jgi:hypothetical protein
MPNLFQKAAKPFSNALQNHISKRVFDNVYDAKVLLGTSIALDVYSNTVDYVQIGQNKKINENDKKYLQAYKLTNSGIITVMQGAAGMYILKESTQEKLIKASQKLTLVPKEITPAIKNNFRVFSTLLGSILLVKRVIVPFLTTPLTSYVRDHLQKSSKPLNTSKKLDIAV